MLDNLLEDLRTLLHVVVTAGFIVMSALILAIEYVKYYKKKIQGKYKYDVLMYIGIAGATIIILGMIYRILFENISIL